MGKIGSCPTTTKCNQAQNMYTILGMYLHHPRPLNQKWRQTLPTMLKFYKSFASVLELCLFCIKSSICPNSLVTKPAIKPRNNENIQIFIFWLQDFPRSSKASHHSVIILPKALTHSNITHRWTKVQEIKEVGFAWDPSYPLLQVSPTWIANTLNGRNRLNNVLFIIKEKVILSKKTLQNTAICSGLSELIKAHLPFSKWQEPQNL